MHIDENLICYKCKHFRIDKDDKDSTLYCAAFNKTEDEDKTDYPTLWPKGIPDEIIDGDNLHKTPLKDQDNDIVFEPVEDE